MADQNHEDGSVTIELEDEHEEGTGQGGGAGLDESSTSGDGAGTQVEEDASGRTDEGDDEEDAGDEAASQGDDHPSKTEINRRNRQLRKEARREREESYRRELAARDATINDLVGRLSAIEQRNTSNDMAQLDNEIRRTADAYNYFKDQIAVASAANDGAGLAEATEKMVTARSRYEALQRHKASRSQQVAAPRPLDPNVAANAQAWMQRNPWYKHNSGEMDSTIVASIDAQLEREGWNPASQDYFNELDARAKKYLPHRYNSGYNQGQPNGGSKPKSVVPGSSESQGSKGNGKRSQGYTVSAERVNALKEAGMWDDPKKRAEAIKRYREYDKQHGNQN